MLHVDDFIERRDVAKICQPVNLTGRRPVLQNAL
jgi:hypothetical protein